MRRLRPMLILALVVWLVPGHAHAQGETTSAIVGEVKDATGAVLAGASVTITNHETGLRRSALTDSAGRFDFPQLKPGTYTVGVKAEGFEPQRNDNVSSGLGQKQNVDFTLKVARSNEVVEVNSEAPLINPADANTSTTLSAPALEDLPNPGGDLTYPLQFSPGALINTAGSGNDFVGGTNGYGNVEFNGLPALSNGYIVDGLETNDPLTNLEQRTFHQPGSGIEFDLRGNRQHAFLFGGSRAVWGFPGELRHQVWDESVSWEFVRAVEWGGAECGGLFYECDARAIISRGRR